MAIPDGKPATDFSAMNREWVRAVAAEAAEAGGLPEITESDEGKFLGVVSGEAAWATAGGGGGIPAPASPSDGDVLTYSSTDSAWVAAAPGGGGGGEVFWINVSYTTEGGERTGAVTDKTAAEIAAAIAAHKLLIAKKDDSDEEATDYKYELVENYLYVPAETMYVARMFDWEFSATSASDYMTYVFE